MITMRLMRRDQDYNRDGIMLKTTTEIAREGMIESESGTVISSEMKRIIAVRESGTGKVVSMAGGGAIQETKAEARIALVMSTTRGHHCSSAGLKWCGEGSTDVR